MGNHVNNVVYSLQRLSHRHDDAGHAITDFMQRQSDGEHPDPEEFVSLLKQQSTTHDAMTAQFKLYEKPMKTVLNDIK